MTEINISYKDISSDFVQIVELDNIPTTIRLTYNVRNDSWKMDLTTENYAIYGLKLVIDYPIINRHKTLFPELSGDFFITSISAVTKDISNFDYDTFGNDFLLYYYTEDEVNEWKVNNGVD